MREKQYYHAALERSLLNGNHLKKRIDRAIGDAPRPVRTNGEWNPRPIPWIAIPVTALLVLATLTIALTGGFARNNRSEQKPGAATAATPEPTEAPTDAVYGDGASLELQNLGTNVKLLPEFEPEMYDECVLWRESHGGRPVTEQDWGWLRSTNVEVESLTVSDQRISWTITVTPERMEPFAAFVIPTDSEQQSIELNLGGATYTVEGDDTVHSLGDVFNGGSWSENGASFTEEWWANPMYFTEPLPDSGIVTVTAQYNVIDFSVEDMGRRFGAVAILEHTFSFDAADLKPVAPEQTLDLALSGTYLLTVRNEEGNGYRTEPVLLDGMRLHTVIDYRRSGIYMTFSIVGAPETKYVAALLSMQDSFGGGQLPLWTDGDTARPVTVEQRAYTHVGEQRVVFRIPLTPKDYNGRASIPFEAFANYVVASGDAPEQADWSWDSTQGSLPETRSAYESLLKTEIPLPQLSK